MAPPSDDEAPRVYVPSSGARRNPKKLQNIGLGQFRRQGPAHHVQPGSATALLNQKLADERMEAWLGRLPAKAPEDKAKGKAKGRGKGKAKTSNKDEETAAATTPVEAGVQCTPEISSTASTSGNVQMGQSQAVVEKGATQKSTQENLSRGSQAPLRKPDNAATTSSGRLKAIAGTWGNRAVENARKAAPKATAATYHTTAMTLGVVDGEMTATVTPVQSQSQPAPKHFFQRSPMQLQPKTVPTKTARKSSLKAKTSKKLQASMWSDDEEGDYDDNEEIDDFLFSSKGTQSTTKRLTRQTNTSSSANKNPIPRKKGPRAQPMPQQKTKTVRFASAVSSSESDSTDETRSSKPSPNVPQKQKQKQKQTTKMTSTSNNSNSSNNNSPTPVQAPSPPSKENLDPGDLSDDEASELPNNKKSVKATTKSTPASASASASKKPLQRPHKKGIARTPMPKRARIDDDDDNDKETNNDDTASPLSKKVKTAVESGQTSPSTSNSKTPPAQRKKGVATKPVQRKKVKATY